MIDLHVLCLVARVLFVFVQETARHLTGECVFAREVWFRVLAPIVLANLAPSPGVAFLDWWLLHRMQLETTRRKGFDSLVILGAWCLWKERNQRVSMGLAARPLMLLL